MMPQMILIVDDNEFIRHALRELFTSESDFDVCGEAENGEEAIVKAKKLHPAVIVMDLSMPLMNGIQAASVLKKLMPKVPIILFSEYADGFSRGEARAKGISAQVSKSEHVSVLLDLARRLSDKIAA